MQKQTDKNILSILQAIMLKQFHLLPLGFMIIPDWQGQILAFDTEQIKLGNLIVVTHTITSNQQSSYCLTCKLRTLQEFKECPNSSEQWFKSNAASATEQQEMLFLQSIPSSGLQNPWIRNDGQD